MMEHVEMEYPPAGRGTTWLLEERAGPECTNDEVHIRTGPPVSPSSTCSCKASPPNDDNERMTPKSILFAMLLRFLFLRKWLRQYTFSKLRLDIIAGLTVGVIIIPQSMAYGVLAGLHPINGLYSSLVPLVVYGLLGSCGQLAVGPTAIHSIIIAEYVAQDLTSAGVDGTTDRAVLAGILAFYSGLLRIGLGICQMGFLANFLSHSVTSGFTSAAGVMICLSQVKDLTGLPISRGRTIFHSLYNIFAALSNVSLTTLMTLTMGATIIVFLLLIKKARWLPKWFPSQLLAMVICTLICWVLNEHDILVIRVLKDIPAGFPPFTAPPSFNLRILVEQYFEPILVLTAMAFMESISLGQKFSRERGYRIDPSQELLAMGMANTVGSLFSGFPITGSFSRSVINAHVGAATPLANIATAAVVAAALGFLTPAFHYLPQTCLAGIIISSAWALVDFHELAWLWKHDLGDRIVWLTAFLATLSLGVSLGVVVGVGISFAMLIQSTAKPHTCVLGQLKDDWRDIRRFPDARLIPRITVFRLDAQFAFTNAEYIRSKIEKTLRHWDDTRCFIVDCRAVNGADSTAVHMLEDLTASLRDREQPVLLILSYTKGPLAGYIGKLYRDQPNAKLLTFNDTKTAVEWSLEHMPQWPGDTEEEPIMDFCI